MKSKNGVFRIIWAENTWKIERPYNARFFMQFLCNLGVQTVAFHIKDIFPSMYWLVPSMHWTSHILTKQGWYPVGDGGEGMSILPQVLLPIVLLVCSE